MMKRIRQALNMTPAKFAELIGIFGGNSGDRIDEMEKGKRPISGPIARILESIDRSFMSSSPMMGVPRWIHCGDAEASSSEPAQILMHTQYPRFWARCCAQVSEQDLKSCAAFQMPVLAMDERTGYTHMVFAFLDHPVGDQEDLLSEAVRLKEAELLQAKA